MDFGEWMWQAQQLFPQGSAPVKLSSALLHIDEFFSHPFLEASSSMKKSECTVFVCAAVLAVWYLLW